MVSYPSDSLASCYVDVACCFIDSLNYGTCKRNYNKAKVSLLVFICQLSAVCIIACMNHVINYDNIEHQQSCIVLLSHYDSLSLSVLH